MKESEVGELLTVIAAAYPKFPSINRTMLKTWYEMFKDVDYKVAQVAIKKIILENTFPPSIAELRQAIVDITTPVNEKLNAGEAWGEVTKALRNFGYARENEALSSMSPKTRKVAEFIGWQNICMSENLDVLRGQFRMMYETLETREKQDKLLPAEMKQMIKGLSEKLKLIGPDKC